MVRRKWRGTSGVARLIIEVIVVEALFIALLDHIAETFRGDEGRRCPLTFDQGIGGERRTVDEDADILRADSSLGDQLCSTFQHGQFRCVGGGQQLSAPALGTLFKNNVGESATDIGSQFVRNSHVLHMPCKRGV